MKLYPDFLEKRNILKKFIRENPNATHRDVKQKLHVKVMKIYSGGLEEAFKDAGVKLPRTFKRMSKEEKRKIIIEFIRKNPNAGGHIIKKETKINLIPVFKDTREAFVATGVNYPRDKLSILRKRTNGFKRKQIVEYLRNNPLENIEDVGKRLNVHPYALFSGIDEIYSRAGFPNFDKSAKRKIKKQRIVIEFIKKNIFATQREINFSCKTKVQGLFENGIFEAYEKARIEFPFERLKLHGTAIKEIKKDAELFEEKIAKQLSCYGNVSRLVKTKRGRADIILERKGKKIAIEVKNYKSHEISISQINQLNKYLEDIGANIGFLVCLRKPKKDSFLIGKNKIVILTDLELSKIPNIMDGSVV